MAMSHKTCMEQAEIIDTFGMYQDTEVLRKVYEQDIEEFALLQYDVIPLDWPESEHKYTVIA